MQDPLGVIGTLSCVINDKKHSSTTVHEEQKGEESSARLPETIRIAQESLMRNCDEKILATLS